MAVNSIRRTRRQWHGVVSSFYHPAFLELAWTAIHLKLFTGLLDRLFMELVKYLAGSNAKVGESKSLDELLQDCLKRYSGIRGSVPDVDFLQSLVSSFQEWNEEIFRTGYALDSKHDWYLLSRLSFAMIWLRDSEFSSLSIALHYMLCYWRIVPVPRGTLFNDPDVTSGCMLSDTCKNWIKELNVSSRNWI